MKMKKMKKMRSKSFPVSSSRRKSLEPYQCRNPIENFEEEEEEEKSGSLKRHYLQLHDSDYCLVCGILDKCVSCSGIDCLLSFHQEELEEDIANLYCPYCWFNILSSLRRDKAVVVGAQNAHLKYLYLEMICRDGVKKSVPKSQDDNVYSVDTTEIVSDQELQGGEGDDACSSKWEQVQIDEDSDQSNLPLVEETDTEEVYYTGKLQERDEVEASDDETAQDQTRVNTGVENGYSTDIVSDQELQGDKDSDQSNMPLFKETDPEEYDTETLQVIDEVEASQDEERVATENCRNDEDDETSQEQTRAGEKGDGSGKENNQVQPNENRRRRIVLKAIDSEISSSESSNKPIGEDVTEQITKVAKSKTVRLFPFSAFTGT